MAGFVRRGTHARTPSGQLEGFTAAAPRRERYVVYLGLWLHTAAPSSSSLQAIMTGGQDAISIGVSALVPLAPLCLVSGLKGINTWSGTHTRRGPTRRDGIRCGAVVTLGAQLAPFIFSPCGCGHGAASMHAVYFNGLPGPGSYAFCSRRFYQRISDRSSNITLDKSTSWLHRDTSTLEAAGAIEPGKYQPNRWLI